MESKIASLERDLQRLEMMKTLLDQTENIYASLWSNLDDVIRETKEEIKSYIKNVKEKMKNDNK